MAISKEREERFLNILLAETSQPGERQNAALALIKGTGMDRTALVKKYLNPVMLAPNQYAEALNNLSAEVLKLVTLIKTKEAKIKDLELKIKEHEEGEEKNNYTFLWFICWCVLIWNVPIYGFIIMLVWMIGRSIIATLTVLRKKRVP